MEQKHQLNNKQFHEEPVFKFSARSRNIKQSLESLFYHLNHSEEIHSKELYESALKLFNVEIQKSGRGHIVVVMDWEGKVIRYPMRLSKFANQPNFKLNLKQEVYLDKLTPSGIIHAKMGVRKDFLKRLLWQIHRNDVDKISKRNYKLKRKTKKRKR